MAIPNDPSVGINAETGATVFGWSHVEQSIRDILFTRFGERVMREWYGSFVPALLGRNITATDLPPVFSAIASALSVFEPRFLVTEMTPVSVTRTGQLHIFIAGEYRPRAAFGDFTADGARRVDVFVASDGIRIEQRLSE